MSGALGAVASEVVRAVEQAAPTVAIAATVVVVLVVALWLLATVRTLAQRVRWAALPSSEFDPAESEVERFAASVGRGCVTRGPIGRLRRSGCAVRVRLSSSGSGRMAYGLEVPGHAVSVVRSSVYSGVVLEEPSAVDLAAAGSSPASPEGGGAGGASASPGRERQERAEGLEWAHAADGGDVVEDWTQDDDPGGRRR